MVKASKDVKIDNVIWRFGLFFLLFLFLRQLILSLITGIFSYNRSSVGFSLSKSDLLKWDRSRSQLALDSLSECFIGLHLSSYSLELCGVGRVDYRDAGEYGHLTQLRALVIHLLLLLMVMVMGILLILELLGLRSTKASRRTDDDVFFWLKRKPVKKGKSKEWENNQRMS